MKLTATLLYLCGLLAMMATLAFASDDVSNEVDKRETFDERELELKARWDDSMKALERRVITNLGYKPWFRRSTREEQRALRALVRRDFFDWARNQWNDVKEGVKNAWNDVKEWANNAWNDAKDKWGDVKEAAKIVAGKQNN